MTIIVIFASILFYSLMSALEIAFVYSNKLRLELDVSDNKLKNKALTFFYENQNIFVSILWLSSLFSLFVCLATINYHYKEFYDYNIYIALLILVIFVTLLLFIDFTLRGLFKFNPTVSFRFFVLPLYIIYIIFYPLLHALIYIIGILNNNKKVEGFIINRSEERRVRNEC